MISWVHLPGFKLYVCVVCVVCVWGPGSGVWRRSSDSVYSDMMAAAASSVTWELVASFSDRDQVFFSVETFLFKKWKLIECDWMKSACERRRDRPITCSVLLSVCLLPNRSHGDCVMVVGFFLCEHMTCCDADSLWTEPSCGRSHASFMWHEEERLSRLSLNSLFPSKQTEACRADLENLYCKKNKVWYRWSGLVSVEVTAVSLWGE